MHDTNDHPTRTVWGLTHFHAETGTEGGYWAVQDARAMGEREDGSPKWSYAGLHLLETGDHLTIYAPESMSESPPPDPEEDAVPAREGVRRWRPDLVWKPRVLWEGEIKLIGYPLFTEDAFGLWIHADQVGVPREEWAAFFLREHICKLRTRRPLEIIGSHDLRTSEYDGFFTDRPRALYFQADGTVRWTPSPAGFTDLHSEWDEPPYTLLQYVKKHARAG